MTKLDNAAGSDLHQGQGISSADRKRALRLLGFAILAMNVGLAAQFGMNANFLVEEIGVKPWQMGYIEAIREACGVVSFFLIGLLAAISEPILAGVMLAIAGVGFIGYWWAYGINSLVVASVVWSLGFHLWLPLADSIGLTLARTGKAGRLLGSMRSIGSAGFVLGLLMILFTNSKLGMRGSYVIAGVMVLVGAIAAFAIPGFSANQIGGRWVIKRRYGFYYLLCFIEGWRKQIFISFATFLLVFQYHAPLKHIVTLVIVNQLICWALAPVVGRLVDRFGEKRILSVYYPTVLLIFLAYANVPYRPFLYGLYVLDNVTFLLGIALPSYLNRITDAQDRRATLAMGLTMNHIASVAMPLLGGILWYYLGYRVPFYCGALVAGAGVLMVRRLPSRQSVSL